MSTKDKAQQVAGSVVRSHPELANSPARREVERSLAATLEEKAANRTIDLDKVTDQRKPDRERGAPERGGR